MVWNSNDGGDDDDGFMGSILVLFLPHRTVFTFVSKIIAFLAGQTMYREQRLKFG
jgi:hypothetical protein